jgi:S1-C subfamily serine protease
LGINRRGGAVINGIASRSAAADAGLREGDVILSVNGAPVRGAADARNQFAMLRVGARVELDILRGGKTRQVTGRIADPYEGYVEGRRIADSLAGALIGELDRQGGVPALPVGTIEPDSPAWMAGLREGDRILQVNGQRVGSLGEAAQIIRHVGGLVSLQIQRGDDLVILARR